MTSSELRTVWKSEWLMVRLSELKKERGVFNRVSACERLLKFPIPVTQILARDHSVDLASGLWI